MTKASDASRLRRLFNVIEFLEDGCAATVAELAERFGGSREALYEDLVSAWVAEDPEHIGHFPIGVEVEFFEADDPDHVPLGDRLVWISRRRCRVPTR